MPTWKPRLPRADYIPFVSLAAFHPTVARWFEDHLGTPTAVQRRGWESIRSGRDTLIAAPTGSGKTLAAFLIALDELVRESLDTGLPDEVRVIYVSPLKALGADIHKNLAEPRREISRLAQEAGLGTPNVTAAVRSGDTTPAERAAMLRKPPHILVTTPESLYLLLTAEQGRKILRTARTVIVDEIHALIESRRGAHLALSLERLDHVAGRRLQRVGLSATQRPIETVAAWLSGDGRSAEVIDEGHRREVDLTLEVPGSPLEAVMSHEVWAETYDRLAELVREHRTTLVFTNTRRLAERVSRHLAERLGEAAVAAHHGSLSKELRLDAEERLKNGALRVLVATASLELGIDIGHVDLVCQLGTPRRIATLLQRVGRSGHSVGGLPKGRVFPLSRDELVECTALLLATQRGELDRIVQVDRPLDVLSQQIVAETAAEPWGADALYQIFRRAHPYRELDRASFDAVVRMLAVGFVTRRGRRGALVHFDPVNGRIRGRRGARLAAVTSGGAIPDTADYRVVAEPEGVFVGTVNEDFAVESSGGDVFQLGNASWRILRLERGTVRVEDARGQPPNIPFWLGEAPARSAELSREVAQLRAQLAALLPDRAAALAWLVSEGVSPAAATQVVDYLAEAERLLGALPTQDTVVAERFFDEAGGMQLILHAPFGSRVNKAWGLALRKKFCRQFNFELQAAATDDAVLLSLGPQHSFPLDSVFRMVSSATARDTLIQAMLDAPVFATRWRWNASISLAVSRFRSGRKVPPQIQRMESDDLLAAAFPDAAACLENIPGDREVPDHPLVEQVVADCLHEAMDFDRFLAVVERIEAGEIRLVARDLPEPSPLAAEILNAKPYAFLDDAPLEERRTQAVYSRRASEPTSAADLGALDLAAIERVREEVWPDVADADELLDALTVSGFLTEVEGNAGRDGVSWTPFFEELLPDGRAGRRDGLWVSGEMLQREFSLDDEATLRELVRGRLEVSGPATAAEIAGLLGVERAGIESALAALEAEGVVLRGYFTPDRGELEWCNRRLLARIHRYTLTRLRAEIEPVTAADLMRFLFVWQRVESGERVQGLEGLATVIDQLQGYEAAAAAWETDLLAVRCVEYDPSQLDMLCLTGRVGWGRLSPPAASDSPAPTRPVRSTPIGLFPREQSDLWLAREAVTRPAPTGYAGGVLAALEAKGASFLPELAAAAGLLPTQAELGLAGLVAAGMVSSDSYAGLRALLITSSKRPPIARASSAGRWSRLITTGLPEGLERIALIERYCRALLARYGVVFHRLLDHETIPASWRELVQVFRRLEARGEIRGGRFVAGPTGEQFALPDAVARLRAVRRAERSGQPIVVSGVDPLNLVGVLVPGRRVAALSGNRIAFVDGVAVAAFEAGEVRWLTDVAEDDRPPIIQALQRRRLGPALRAALGHAGGRRAPVRAASRRSRSPLS